MSVLCDQCWCRCAAAYVLLAEEEATTITEAERLFKQALKSGRNHHDHFFTPSVPWTKEKRNTSTLLVDTI